MVPAFSVQGASDEPRATLGDTEVNPCLLLLSSVRRAQELVQFPRHLNLLSLCK